MVGGERTVAQLNCKIKRNVFPVLYRIGFVDHSAYAHDVGWDNETGSFRYHFIRDCGEGKINLLQATISSRKVGFYLDLCWIRVKGIACYQPEDIVWCRRIKTANFIKYAKYSKRFNAYYLKKGLFFPVSEENSVNRCIEKALDDIPRLDAFAKDFERPAVVLDFQRS